MSNLFICPDCELVVSSVAGQLCDFCAQWREQKLKEMDQDYQDRQDRLRRLRMTPAERFAEALADLAKAGRR